MLGEMHPPGTSTDFSKVLPKVGLNTLYEDSKAPNVFVCFLYFFACLLVCLSFAQHKNPRNMFFHRVLHFRISL